MKTISALLTVALVASPAYAFTIPATWVAGDQTASGTPITYLTSTWLVPQAPWIQQSQWVNEFDALGSGSCIIQPVLQWNSSVANQWAMVAIWNCGSATSSTPVIVQPGDTITGTMSLSAGTWTISVTDNTIGQATSITVPAATVGSMTSSSVGILEAQTSGQCFNYPATPVTFNLGTYNNGSGNVPAPVTPTVFSPTGCNEAASVGINGELVVDIDYAETNIPPIGYPTGQLLINGRPGTYHASAGQPVTYSWNSTNGSTFSSVLQVTNGPNTCGDSQVPWIASTAGGSALIPSQACQAGTTYVFSYVVTGASGTYTASATLAFN